MRHFLITIMLAMTSVMSFAQTDTLHLRFKGIPIDGTLTDFSKKLVQKGYTYLGTENDVALLKGEFATYKDCTIGALAIKEQKVTCKVAVIFPERETWSLLENNYIYLKNKLIAKYGKPTINEESFQSYSQPKDDNSKMYELKFDRCKYYAVFETEKGDIELQITHQDVTRCYVMLSYYDKINGAIVQSEAMDDL